mmetsp:Transcript_80578/g.159566  ORF Transcript_80578/g.159566 Transcript_80578/m.159566 type:complete len:315 (-) Transcript_80578:60-1004(-)
MGAKCLRAAASEDFQGDVCNGDRNALVSSQRPQFWVPLDKPADIKMQEESVIYDPFETGANEHGPGSWETETREQQIIMGGPCTSDKRMSSRQRFSSPPPVTWSRGSFQSTPVTLHVYNIGTASVGRALNRILKPLGTGAFHCGVEVYGCEWSYSDTTTGLGDGVFASRPRCCSGHDYSESVEMGSVTMTAVEVARLIQLLKKEWPVHEYNTLKRNCCHWSNEFCQRLGLGSIPNWVMNLAGAGAAIAASGDLTCCRQVAVQVGKTCCCAGAAGDDAIETVDVVEAIPVLPRTEMPADQSGWQASQRTPRERPA